VYFVFIGVAAMAATAIVLAAFRWLFSFPRRKQLNYSKVAVTFENGSYCGEDRIEFSLLFFNL